VRLIIRNATQCYDTISKPVTISANPVAAFTADTACLGALMHFTDASTSASGTTIIGWQWNFGDGSAVSTLQNPTHLYGAPGNYTVTLTVTTNMDCQHTVNHPVLVKIAPVAMFTSADHCRGSLTHFTDQSTTTSGIINAWDWNFGDATISTLQNPSHQYANAGTYQVRLIATNSGGCPDTVTIPVVIQQRPTAAFSYASYNCPAGKVTFADHSIPAGSQVNSWYWTFEPGFYSTAPNPTYTYNYQDSNYVVSLIIHDQNGCSDTIESTVYVKAGFDLTFNTESTCLGDSTHFQPVNLATGDPLHDLHWTFGEASSGINNTSNLYEPAHAYANAGSYIVKLRASNSDNCTDSAFKEVVVHPLPLADFSYESIPCDTNVTFNNLCFGNGSAIDSLVWIFGDGTDSTQIAPFVNEMEHTYPGFGSYNASVTVFNHYGCWQTDSSLITVGCIASSFKARDTLLCQNTRVCFIDHSAPVNLIYQWQWIFGDGDTLVRSSYSTEICHTYAAPGTYIVKLNVQTQNGSSSTATSTQQVIIKPSPIADFSVGSVCKGDTSKLINLSDSNNVNLLATQWRFGDPTSGANDSSSLFNPVHQFLTSGSHIVTLTLLNELGCSDTIRKTALVHKLPQAGFTNSTPCERYDVRYQNTSVKGDTIPTIWAWNFGNPLEPYNTLFTKDVTYRIDSAGTYLVYMKVQDKFGCWDTVTKLITVRPSPVAAFTITDNIDGKQGKIRLNNESSDDAKGFKWTFGNGKTSTEVNPVVTFNSDAQVYTIELVTWNAGLCYDTTYLPYEFLFDNLFVPNAFSPTNLSGSLGCREFLPKGINLKEYHVMIFDKWGHLIWESKELTADGQPAKSWDGTFNGEPMPQDVYMWKINATFTNGQVWEGSDAGKGSTTTMGTVTLIR
jgi:gliding motility-associated-like protein